MFATNFWSAISARNAKRENAERSTLRVTLFQQLLESRIVTERIPHRAILQVTVFYAARSAGPIQELIDCFVLVSDPRIDSDEVRPSNCAAQTGGFRGFQPINCAF